MGWLSDLDSSFHKPPSVRPLALRYGTALVFVNIALFVSLLLQGVLPHAFLILFLAAILASGWYCRVGPGMFSVAVSVLAMGYYFIPPYRALSIHVQEIPYVISFLLSGI